MTAQRALDAATKITAVALTLASAAVFNYVYDGGWRWGWWIAAGAFAIPAVLVRVAPAAALGLVLLWAYTMPAAIGLITGPTHPIAQVLWIVTPLAIVVSSGRHWRWHVPASWTYPLAAWCLTVVVSGLIVMGREADFVPRLTFRINVPNTGIGGPPELMVAWIASVAAVTGTGLLWIDWLFQQYGEGRDRFARHVVAPLVASALISTSVAFVQAIRPGFLNTGLYAFLRRASGTMLDANSYGVSAALWATVLLGLAFSHGAQLSPWRKKWITTAGAAMLMLGAWFSGSRSCLVILCCGIAVAILYAARHSRLRDGNAAQWFGISAVLLASLVVVALTIRDVGPMRRLMESLPASPGPFVRELWNRGAYGPAAVLMIREFPVAGVGVGSFHFLLNDYAMRATGIYMLPDNAQNWYRHEMAELGVLGSLPWMVWLAVVVAAIIRRRRAVAASPFASVLLAALVGFGLASLVGVPGQNAAVVITFWTLVFWLMQATGAVSRRGHTEQRAWSIAAWVVVLVLVAAHAAVTTYAAVGPLRVPYRAARGNWRYAYGLYSREVAPDGTEFHWARDRALAVVDAADRWMHLKLIVAPPDVDAHPAAVRAWCDGTPVIDQQVSTRDPIAVSLWIPEHKKRVVIETQTDRVWRPRDSGTDDPRELGLSVAWSFGPKPPAEAGTRIVRIR